MARTITPHSLRQLSITLLLLAFLSPLGALATNAENLQQLLTDVKQYQDQEKRLHQQREARFLQAKDQQSVLLQQAKHDFLVAQKKNNPLQKLSDQKLERINQLRDELARLDADMGGVNATFQQFAGDFAVTLETSLIHSEIPTRQAVLSRLKQVNTLSRLDDLKILWLAVQQEMTLASTVSQFQQVIAKPDGRLTQETLYRIGPFTVQSDSGLFIQQASSDDVVDYASDKALLELKSLPYSLERQIERSSLTLTQSKDSNESAPVQHTVLIDPSRGTLLKILGQHPDFIERIMQGKAIGLTIIGLGVLGLCFALYRFVYLMVIKLRIKRQLRSLTAMNDNNPLGRILKQANKALKTKQGVLHVDLQLTLDEAILKELPPLERGLSFIKLLAAAAPLLGLLGTVTGMIATFQSISLYGSGDPKLMASGISQALMTTVLGLLSAIPLLFIHNALSTLSQHLVQILDEQAAALLIQVQCKNDEVTYPKLSVDNG